MRASVGNDTPRRTNRPRCEIQHVRHTHIPTSRHDAACPGRCFSLLCRLLPSARLGLTLQPMGILGEAMQQVRQRSFSHLTLFTQHCVWTSSGRCRRFHKTPSEPPAIAQRPSAPCLGKYAQVYSGMASRIFFFNFFVFGKEACCLGSNLLTNSFNFFSPLPQKQF